MRGAASPRYRRCSNRWAGRCTSSTPSPTAACPACRGIAPSGSATRLEILETYHGAGSKCHPSPHEQTMRRGENHHRALIGRAHSGRVQRQVAGVLVSPGQLGSVDCDRHTLSGCRLFAVRLPRPQRQFVVPSGKSRRDHYELSQLICNRSINGFAVA